MKVQCGFGEKVWIVRGIVLSLLVIYRTPNDKRRVEESVGERILSLTIAPRPKAEFLQSHSLIKGWQGTVKRL